MKRNTLLVLGAKSDIGIAVAHKFAKEGFDIQLAARNANALKDDCIDINIRYGVGASYHELDALEINSHENLISSLKKIPDIAIYAIGVLGNQDEDEKDIKKSVETIRTNFIGLVSIFGILANHFQKKVQGP